MYKTKWIDYLVVIIGEMWTVMEVGEVLLRPRGYNLHRGINHAWANDKDRPRLLASTLIDANPAP